MERAPVHGETDASEREDADETRVEPIMEAPDVTASSTESASWNPAQGDRSFGYGSGAQQRTRSEVDAAGGQGDIAEDAP